MTDTLIAIDVESGPDKLVRLSGFTSSVVGSPIAVDSVLPAPTFQQARITGCTWNKDSDACYVGYEPGGFIVKLDGFTSTRKDQLQFATSVVTNDITCNGDNPIVNADNAVRELSGWTSTIVRSAAIQLHGVEWDGNNLYAATYDQFASRLRRYKVFTSTIERELSVSGGGVDQDNKAVGISYDGRDTIWCGFAQNRLHKQVAFTSTVGGSSVDVSGFGGAVVGLSHMSYAERTAQQTPANDLGTYWCGNLDQAGAGGSVYQQTGFTSTLYRTLRLALTDSPEDMAWDGSNVHWCGKKNTVEPILRRCSQFSTSVLIEIPTSGLGETNPKGISIDLLGNVYFCGRSSDALYRLVQFTSVVSASQSCPVGHHEPDAISFVGSHTLWIAGQSGLIVRSPGFSSAITETLTPPIHFGSATGVSFTGTDAIWADLAIGDNGNEALVKQVGFTTTIKSVAYIGVIDNNPSGIDHGDFTLRAGSGYATVLRPRASRRVRRRRRGRVVRIGHPSRFAAQPVIGSGIAPLLRPRVVDAIRHRRRRRIARIGHPSQFAAQPAIDIPPQLGDIMWCGLTSQAMYLHSGFTTTQRNVVSLSAQPTGPAGMTWDLSDAYVTFNDGGGGATYLDRFDGFSSTVQNQIQFTDRFLATVAWNGQGIVVSDSVGNHSKLVGLTTTIQESYSIAPITPNYSGLSWTGADVLWTALSPTPRIYRQAGFSGVVVDEVPQTVNPSDVTWDGANAYVSQISTGRLRKLAGLSGTITDTVDISGDDNFPAGLVLADVRYRLAGPNMVRGLSATRAIRHRRRGRTFRVGHPSQFAAQPAAPVAFSPAIFRTRCTKRMKRRKRKPTAHAWAPHLIDIRRHYFTARGKYRVFNAAVYRFYRSNTGPPAETDAPFATSASLPSTPANTYADGTWWISVSYFNGVIDSGFLPLGPNGERYVRLDIASGAVAGSPPQPPGDWRLEVRAGGVIRIVAFYFQVDSNRATDWAIAYTTNGSTPGTPPAVSPTVTVLMPTRGLAILSYDLPAQANGTTVKVRLQTKRSSTYSENSVVKTAIADATGPSAPAVGQRWPGRLPETL